MITCWLYVKHNNELLPPLPSSVARLRTVSGIFAVDGSLGGDGATFAIVTPKVPIDQLLIPPLPASGNWDDADRATISSQFLVIKGSFDSPIFARPPGVAEAEAFALGIVTNYLSYFSTHGVLLTDSNAALNIVRRGSRPISRAFCRSAIRQAGGIANLSASTSLVKVKSHSSGDSLYHLIHSLADYHASNNESVSDDVILVDADWMLAGEFPYYVPLEDRKFLTADLAQHVKLRYDKVHTASWSSRRPKAGFHPQSSSALMACSTWRKALRHACQSLTNSQFRLLICIATNTLNTRVLVNRKNSRLEGATVTRCLCGAKEDSVAHWPVCSRHSARRRICFRKCIDAIITVSGNHIDNNVKATALSLLRRAQTESLLKFFTCRPSPLAASLKHLFSFKGQLWKFLSPIIAGYLMDIYIVDRSWRPPPHIPLLL